MIAVEPLRKITNVRSPSGNLVAVPTYVAQFVRLLSKPDTDVANTVKALMDAYAAFGFLRGGKRTGTHDDVYSAWIGEVAARMPWMVDRAMGAMGWVAETERAV